MSVHDILMTHPVTAQIALSPRWTISEPGTKKPLDLRGFLLDGHGPYGAQFPDQRCLLTLSELRDFAPNPINCAFRLEAGLDGLLVLDIEPSCDPVIAERFLSRLPWLYAEASMSGRGAHLLMPLPVSFHHFPNAIAKPKVQSEDSTYEVLISHYATFTGRPLPRTPPPMNQESLAEWDRLWCSLAAPADRRPSLTSVVFDGSDLSAMATMDDAELEDPSWDDDEVRVPGLTDAIETLTSMHGLDDLSDHHGDHSKWHWALLGDLHERLTEHLSDYEDPRPVAEQVRVELEKWSRITKSPPPPQPLYGPDQEAFIIYRALIELVPHRPKHDELRDGLPLLLAAAAKLVSQRRETTHVSLPQALFGP